MGIVHILRTEVTAKLSGFEVRIVYSFVNDCAAAVSLNISRYKWTCSYECVTSGVCPNRGIRS
jgi:hypothetical protein